MILSPPWVVWGLRCGIKAAPLFYVSVIIEEIV